jgi:hypothetical protein
MNATTIHTHTIAPTVISAARIVYEFVYAITIILSIAAAVSANNAEEYSTNFINVFMVVRFNSRNKGGIGTPYFNYLFG